MTTTVVLLKVAFDSSFNPTLSSIRRRKLSVKEVLPTGVMGVVSPPERIPPPPRADDFQVTINSDLCGKETVDVVTIVTSATTHFAARQDIRNSWAKPQIPGVNMRLVFVLGLSTNSSIQKSLEMEAEQYGDIIQGNFIDTYFTLSYKSLFAFYWTLHFCAQADFLIKTDDDIYIDLYETYHYTRRFLTTMDYASGQFLACLQKRVNTIPIKRQGSKYYAGRMYIDAMREQNITDPRFPPFCVGWMYLTSPATAKRLLEASKDPPYFLPLEDVWITGFLAETLEIPRHALNPLFVRSVYKMLASKERQTASKFNHDYLASFTDVSKNISAKIHALATRNFREQRMNNTIYQQ